MGPDLVSLGDLDVEWAEFAAVSDNEVVRGKRDQRACALAPTGHKDGHSLVAVLQRPADLEGSIRVSARRHQDHDDILGALSRFQVVDHLLP